MRKSVFNIEIFRREAVQLVKRCFAVIGALEGFANVRDYDNGSDADEAGAETS